MNVCPRTELAYLLMRAASAANDRSENLAHKGQDRAANAMADPARRAFAFIASDKRILSTGKSNTKQDIPTGQTDHLERAAIRVKDCHVAFKQGQDGSIGSLTQCVSCVGNHKCLFRLKVVIEPPPAKMRFSASVAIVKPRDAGLGHPLHGRRAHSRRQKSH